MDLLDRMIRLDANSTPPMEEMEGDSNAHRLTFPILMLSKRWAMKHCKSYDVAEGVDGEFQSLHDEDREIKAIQMAKKIWCVFRDRRSVDSPQWR